MENEHRYLTINHVAVLIFLCVYIPYNYINVQLPYGRFRQKF